MKLLLHTCCGPCSIYPVSVLRQEGHDLTGYFYNPNIHPLTEFRKRLETLQGYAGRVDLPLIVDEKYELDEYLRQVVFREGDRCRVCYAMRLRKAAEAAIKGEYDAFTTTLLVSPYQTHEQIREIGTAIGVETGIPFLYLDFRPGYREATRISREENMYRQQYCGCIYSERDRYAAKKK